MPSRLLDALCYTLIFYGFQNFASIILRGDSRLLHFVPDGKIHAQHASLQGPAFDAEARRQQGRVFSWIDRMLRGPHTHDSPGSTATSLRSLGPSKASVACTALLNMLSTNPEVLPVFLHQCYSAEPILARTYFQVKIWPGSSVCSCRT